MQYNSTILLRTGEWLTLRSGTEEDGPAVYENFTSTHAETDFLLTYPDENSFTPEQEAAFLKEKLESNNSVEILAIINGTVAGTAGIEPIGSKYKIAHRAEFGISVSKAYWNCGIGRALTAACIECAQKAGYSQLELSVVGNNTRAIKLYESLGFTEYSKNPRGFRSRISGYQELLSMRLELE